MFFPRKLIISITSLFFMSLLTYVNILWIFYASFYLLLLACFSFHWLLPFSCSWVLFVLCFFSRTSQKVKDKHKGRKKEMKIFIGFSTWVEFFWFWNYWAWKFDWGEVSVRIFEQKLILRWLIISPDLEMVYAKLRLLEVNSVLEMIRI